MSVIKRFIPHLAALSLGAAFCSLPTYAQAPAAAPVEAAEDEFDPATAYFEAFLLKQDASAHMKKDEPLPADEKFRSALRLLRSIQTVHPEFKSKLLADQVRKIEKSIFEAAGQASTIRGEQAALGNQLPGAEVASSAPAAVTPPAVHAERRDDLDRLYKEIQQLKSRLAQADLDRTANRAQLRTSIMQLEQERARKANAPLKEEMNALAERLKITEEERDAMAVALKQSRAEHRQLTTHNITLQTDLTLAKEQIETLETQIKDERNTNNDLVKNLRDQQKTLVAQITQKERSFEAAQEQISDLQQRLDESMAVVDELREERDSLLVERDRLSDLLELSDSDRSKELINQNMQLGKQLREAKENLTRVANSDNRTKTELVAAQTDLAVAKARIETFVKRAAEQDRRIVEKEERLKQVEADLELAQFSTGGGTSDIDSREVRLLREVAQRQLRQQSVRRQAKNLLIENAQALGVLADLLDPIQALAGADIGLSPEERALVEATPPAEVDLFSVDAAPAEVRERAQRRLKQQIGSFTRVGQRAFVKERFTAAAEVFELILDEHPGHVESLLSLGVVSRKLHNMEKAEECFRSAVTMRESVPYAHRLLGSTLYEMQKFEDARAELQRAIELDPTDPISHIFLGNIAGKNGDLLQAEEHFTKAININPALPDPYLNLATIRAKQGRKKDARTYYQQALENGAQVNLALERLIAA